MLLVACVKMDWPRLSLASSLLLDMTVAPVCSATEDELCETAACSLDSFCLSNSLGTRAGKAYWLSSQSIASGGGPNSDPRAISQVVNGICPYSLSQD